jgi:transposase-like protein
MIENLKFKPFNISQHQLKTYIEIEPIKKRIIHTLSKVETKSRPRLLLLQAETLYLYTKKKKYQKYSNEFKMSLIISYLLGSLKIPQVATKYGIDRGSLYRWVNQYTTDNDIFFSNRQQSKVNGCHIFTLLFLHKKNSDLSLVKKTTELNLHSKISLSASTVKKIIAQFYRPLPFVQPQDPVFFEIKKPKKIKKSAAGRRFTDNDYKGSVVRYYLGDEVTLEFAAQKYDVNPKSLARWVSQYKKDAWVFNTKPLSVSPKFAEVRKQTNIIRHILQNISIEDMNMFYLKPEPTNSKPFKPADEVLPKITEIKKPKTIKSIQMQKFSQMIAINTFYLRTEMIEQQILQGPKIYAHWIYKDLDLGKMGSTVGFWFEPEVKNLTAGEKKFEIYKNCLRLGKILAAYDKEPIDSKPFKPTDSKPFKPADERKVPKAYKMPRLTEPTDSKPF